MKYICILFLLAFSGNQARADFWGADIPILSQILVQATAQVRNTIQLLGNARDTLSILQEMNRGVKEVLRLAETAHIPLPPQVYENAKNIDDATKMATKAYGVINDKAPIFTKTNFKSGLEGLFLSQDTIDYSSFLDTRVCFSVPSVTASTLVIGDMTASTLGGHSGRAVFQLSGNKIIQAPLIKNQDVESLMKSLKERLSQSNYQRSLNPRDHLTNEKKPKVVIK